jgi:RHS repeat-associated protein
VNQYTQAGQEPLAYDPNGNLIQMGSRWNASYDGANRLVQAQAQGNTMTVAYDAFHRPVTRTVNERTLHMVWDGWQLAEERTADNALVARYIHGQGPDEIISRTDAIGATLYYHHDGLGNTLALTDASGQVVERYSYDAFGTPHVYDAAFNPLSSSSVHNRFLFTDREWIAELNLYDYRNRVYSAELGRFLQTDPIRFKAGDLNLYRYCRNRVTHYNDPWGLANYTYEETRRIVDVAGQQNVFQAAWNHLGIHNSVYDFRYTGDTFETRPGRRMSGGEFGNYLAAHTGQKIAGSAGYWGARFGGLLFNASEAADSEDVSFNWDADSVPALEEGRADAIRENEELEIWIQTHQEETDPVDPDDKDPFPEDPEQPNPSCSR